LYNEKIYHSDVKLAHNGTGLAAGGGFEAVSCPNTLKLDKREQNCPETPLPRLQQTHVMGWFSTLSTY